MVAICVGLDAVCDGMACKAAITKEEHKWVIELTKDTAYLGHGCPLWAF